MYIVPTRNERKELGENLTFFEGKSSPFLAGYPTAGNQEKSSSSLDENAARILKPLKSGMCDWQIHLMQLLVGVARPQVPTKSSEYRFEKSEQFLLGYAKVHENASKT